MQYLISFLCVWEMYTKIKDGNNVFFSHLTVCCKALAVWGIPAVVSGWCNERALDEVEEQSYLKPMGAMRLASELFNKRRVSY